MKELYNFLLSLMAYQYGLLYFVLKYTPLLLIEDFENQQVISYRLHSPNYLYPIHYITKGTSFSHNETHNSYL